MDAGSSRLRGAAIPALQASAFSTLSWWFCYYILHDPAPIFAPIVTFVCMGLSRNRELRKAIEMAFGASLGVLIGGLVGEFWGFGPIQLFGLLLVCSLLGRFIDRSEMVAFQMAIQSVVVASIIAYAAIETTVSTGVSRFLNAVVGGIVAILATVVLPTDVMTRPKRYESDALLEAARVMTRLGRALREGDAKAIASLSGRLAAMREVLNDGRRALASAQETAAVSPRAFRSRTGLAELDRMLELTERMHVTLSAMQSQSRSMVADVGPMPTVAKPLLQASHLVEEISKGISDWNRPTEARDQTVVLASTLAPRMMLQEDDDWRSATLISLVRAITVDMLEITGFSMAQARSALGDSDGSDRRDLPEAPDVELGSAIWGTEQLPAIGRFDIEDMRRRIKKNAYSTDSDMPIAEDPHA